MLRLATKIQGNCSTCLTLIDAGDWFDPAARVHAECRSRVREAATSEPTSGFLFNDPVRAEIERVKEKVGATRLVIHGKTYNEEQDQARLTRQLLAVFELMKDGLYRDTELIASALHIGPTSAHARLRQLRAIGHGVPKRWIKGDDGSRGHFEYALIINRSLMGNEWEGQRGSHAA